MATTRFYLTADDAIFTGVTTKGTWTSTSGATNQRLSKARSGAAAVSGPSNDTVTTNPNKRQRAVFISGPLKAQTIAGNLILRMLAHESDAAANTTAAIHAWISVGDTDVARGTLISNQVGSQEYVVDATNYDCISETFTLSSVAVTAGDRLVIEIGNSFANAVATAYTAHLIFGGSVSDLAGTETGVATSTSASGYVEFDSAILTQYETVYITNDGAPVTPGATRGTWDVTASLVDVLLGRAPSGSNNQVQIAEIVTTNPYDIVHFRAVSPPLAAQTIAGTVLATLRALESSASADAFVKVHLYIMKPDGTVRATLLSNTVDGVELGTATNKRTTFTLSSQSAVDGDRLVLEIGSRFTNTVTTSFNTSHYAGQVGGEANNGANPSASNQSSWLEFESGLVWQTTNLVRNFAVVVG